MITIRSLQEQEEKYFDWAEEEGASVFLRHFAALAKELRVVLPVSFFERRNNAFYNSVVVFDADGENLGKYRKTHIPDGPGYQEKFYFTPGDTGFRVFRTAYGVIGVGICWDQWFPETARSLVLNGAELLFFPTAIGSEPKNESYDSSGHWQRAMVGHAASNMVPVIASNRVGVETFAESSITFYGERSLFIVISHLLFLSAPLLFVIFHVVGTSFITDHTGKVVQQADRTSTTVLVAEFDLDAIRRERRAWGLFRDRRPNTYATLLTKDGSN